MEKDLVFEIGTEELPAAFVPKALNSLEGFLRKDLEAKRLAFKGVRTLGTPRRLALIVEGLADRQPDTRVEVRGPQTRAAFDAKGAPTNALEGFCKSQGLSVKDIKTVKTEKGEYVYAVKEIKGEKTAKILPEILLSAVSRDFFPKSMRWNDYDISFARPIHWILSVYGASPVRFSYGHIKSSGSTYGHRFLGAPKPIKVTGVSSYIEGLSASFVVADPQERKKIILEGLEKEAREAGGVLVDDPALLEEVAYLVEYPVVVRGSFGREFLEIPRDVVINAMREHQRYFSIVSGSGELLPYFLTVANTRAVDMAVVRKGNERVLKARLNDAKFYFEQDIKKRLIDRVEALKGVVFQARLGTSYEKVERFTGLALFIGSRAGFSRPLENGEKASDFLSESFNPASLDPACADPGLYSKLVVGRAAVLAKADLTSGMVGEFPKLQGAMGSIYAARNGEAPQVAVAICEHYLPSASGGALPASVAGAVVSIADKLDTIAGCFGVGLIPTGAQDPYALRRQALGVIAIILEKDMRLRLDELVDEALRLLSPKLTRDKKEVRGDVLEFFKERLKHLLLGRGLSFDATDAVLCAPWFDMVDAVKRISALEGFKKHPACPSLVTAFKRVSNILKGLDLAGKKPQPALFTDPEEAALYKAASDMAPVIEELWENSSYEKAFEALASIKDRIDAFFDKVMVMVEDEKTKTNRLVLLNSVRDLYFKIADLSRLMV